MLILAALREASKMTVFYERGQQDNITDRPDVGAIAKCPRQVSFRLPWPCLGQLVEPSGRVALIRTINMHSDCRIGTGVICRHR